MNNRITLSLLAMLLIAPLSNLNARVINVPDDFETIQAGIDAAEREDTVLVSPGVYVENIDFTGKDIVVASLFLINGDIRLIEETIIDGNREGSVVTIIDRVTDSAKLCGFSIRNGSGTSYFYGEFYGGGIFVVQSDVIIEHCRIYNNSIDDGDGLSVGGGIAVVGWIDNTHPTIRDCEVFANESGARGGGIGLAYTNAILERVTVYDNFAELGGGLFITNECNVTIRQSVIRDNHAGNRGGGILAMYSASFSLENVTLAGNRSDVLGGSILMFYANNMNAVNTIIWANNPSEIYVDENGDRSSMVLSYSAIEDGENGIITNDNADVHWGEGNIDEDPIFADPDNDDYHLTADSPCIDAGDPESPPDPDSTRADMGAFFFHRRDICVVPDTLMFGEMAEAADTLNLVIRNLGHENLEIITHWFEPVNSPFRLISDEEDFFVIEPESDHVMTIAFIPPGQGDYRGVFNIISNDPDEETVTVMLIGSALSAEDPFILHPSAFILHEPFPNPFNSVTRIAYNLQQADYIELAVYDLTGRKVDVIERDFKPGGCYTTSYDASHLPSGVYTLSLTTAERSSVRKMLLIK